MTAHYCTCYFMLTVDYDETRVEPDKLAKFLDIALQDGVLVSDIQEQTGELFIDCFQKLDLKDLDR